MVVARTRIPDQVSVGDCARSRSTSGHSDIPSGFPISREETCWLVWAGIDTIVTYDSKTESCRSLAQRSHGVGGRFADCHRQLLGFDHPAVPGIGDADRDIADRRHAGVAADAMGDGSAVVRDIAIGGRGHGHGHRHVPSAAGAAGEHDAEGTERQVGIGRCRRDRDGAALARIRIEHDGVAGAFVFFHNERAAAQGHARSGGDAGIGDGDARAAGADGAAVEPSGSHARGARGRGRRDGDGHRFVGGIAGIGFGPRGQHDGGHPRGACHAGEGERVAGEAEAGAGGERERVLCVAGETGDGDGHHQGFAAFERAAEGDGEGRGVAAVALGGGGVGGGEGDRGRVVIGDLDRNRAGGAHRIAGAGGDRGRDRATGLVDGIRSGGHGEAHARRIGRNHHFAGTEITRRDHRAGLGNRDVDRGGLAGGVGGGEREGGRAAFGDGCSAAGDGDRAGGDARVGDGDARPARAAGAAGEAARGHARRAAGRRRRDGDGHRFVGGIRGDAVGVRGESDGSGGIAVRVNAGEGEIIVGERDIFGVGKREGVFGAGGEAGHADRHHKAFARNEPAREGDGELGGGIAVALGGGSVGGGDGDDGGVVVRHRHRGLVGAHAVAGAGVDRHIDRAALLVDGIRGGADGEVHFALARRDDHRARPVFVGREHHAGFGHGHIDRDRIGRGGADGEGEGGRLAFGDGGAGADAHRAAGNALIDDGDARRARTGGAAVEAARGHARRAAGRGRGDGDGNRFVGGVRGAFVVGRSEGDGGGPGAGAALRAGEGERVARQGNTGGGGDGKRILGCGDAGNGERHFKALAIDQPAPKGDGEHGRVGGAAFKRAIVAGGGDGDEGGVVVGDLDRSRAGGAHRIAGAASDRDIHRAAHFVGGVRGGADGEGGFGFASGHHHGFIAGRAGREHRAGLRHGVVDGGGGDRGAGEGDGEARRSAFGHHRRVRSDGGAAAAVVVGDREGGAAAGAGAAAKAGAGTRVQRRERGDDRFRGAFVQGVLHGGDDEAERIGGGADHEYARGGAEAVVGDAGGNRAGGARHRVVGGIGGGAGEAHVHGQPLARHQCPAEGDGEGFAASVLGDGAGGHVERDGGGVVVAHIGRDRGLAGDERVAGVVRRR